MVERANKDIAIESLLNTFEEVWLSRQLELRPHRRVVDIARQEVSRYNYTHTAHTIYIARNLMEK